MAYVAYEDLTPARVNYRVVPKLRKYYRADGTFDLFDINKRQMCCFRFLASKNEFGFNVGRSDFTASFGRIGTNPGIGGALGNKCTLTGMNFIVQSAVSKGAAAGHDLLLKINNSAGYYPYYVVSGAQAGHYYGSTFIKLYDSSGSEKKVVKSSPYANTSLSYSMTFNTPSTLWDYKDYNYVRLYGYAADGTKFVVAYTNLQVYGIHKFNDNHPLYRYYR